MDTQKISIVLVSIVIVGSLWGCAETAQNEVTLKVIGNGTNFTGGYSRNGGDYQPLTPVEAVAPTFTVFGKDFEDVDLLEVYAIRDDPVSELAIKFYRNNKIVKEDSIDETSTATTLSVDYTFGEEDTSTQ
ncbi:MAG: hypothetical protein EPN93_17090 [Spirochaetes bacterium]|nr:MAG: hypothetical protein EPN93_17090 [Spirochaetota bacterium]